ncbi:MAG: L,D-transpeptidase family protein [Candidatus Eisenbacteria bacterium]|nr:L,D-transpeptidase family protein [Candidatus Eisenbacteria bacterium]
MRNSLRIALIASAITSWVYSPAWSGVDLVGRVAPERLDQAELARLLTPGPPSAAHADLLKPEWTAEAYRRHDHRPIFVGSAAGLARADDLLAALREVSSEGLAPARYRPEPLEAAIAAIPKTPNNWWERLTTMGQSAGTARALADVDRLLTDRYLALAADRRGLTDRDSARVDSLIGLLAAPPPPPIGIWAPAHPQYKRLMDALALYRKLAGAGGWPTIDAGGKLQKGDRDSRVGQIRARLDAEDRLLRQFGGISSDSLASFAVAEPELFDAGLKKRLADFQISHALEGDGVAGKGTVVEMNITAGERVRQIERTLERWRHGPGDAPEHRVEVVIPGMWLELYEDGNPVLTLKTVVGSGRESAAWKGKTSVAETPELIDMIERIEVNPKWHIPEIIIRTELLSKEKKSPGFLDKGGYEWYQPGTGKFGPASELPDSVWGGKKRLFLRQRSGDANALGKMKFLFPNPFAVYLHDTPDKKYFKRTRRAFSHGCVRVENPSELAQRLIASTETKPPKTLSEMLRSSKLHTVTMTPHVPIHLLYRTTWVQADGRVRFLNDLYGWDASFDSLSAERR